MTDCIAILAEHVAETLPDSISKRLAVLEALRQLVKATHPAYRPICEQIHTLKTAQRLQKELPLSFTK